MLGQGTESEIRQPLGCAVVGGLIVSQVADLVHNASDLSLPRQVVGLALKYASCPIGRVIE
jgi:hypothetical protein